MPVAIAMEYLCISITRHLSAQSGSCDLSGASPAALRNHFKFNKYQYQYE
jgi:hypothetical protein